VVFDLEGQKVQHAPAIEPEERVSNGRSTGNPIIVFGNAMSLEPLSASRLVRFPSSIPLPYLSLTTFRSFWEPRVTSKFVCDFLKRLGQPDVLMSQLERSSPGWGARRRRLSLRLSGSFQGRVCLA
jgi:hypothetical protein